MNTEHGRRPAHRSWLRAGLLVLVVMALGAGLWALLLPRTFYDDFPLPGRNWISTLGPYNEHLVVDYGALNLALGVLLIFVAVLLERRLVQVSLVAWLCYAVPHFIFHVMQIHHFSFGDNLAQLTSLGLQVLLPLVLLPLTRTLGMPLQALAAHGGSATSINAGQGAARKPAEKEREHEEGTTL